LHTHLAQNGMHLVLLRATMCKVLACRWHGLLVGTSIPCHLHITCTLDWKSPHQYIKHHSTQTKQF